MSLITWATPPLVATTRICNHVSTVMLADFFHSLPLLGLTTLGPRWPVCVLGGSRLHAPNDRLAEATGLWPWSRSRF